MCKLMHKLVTADRLVESFMYVYIYIIGVSQNWIRDRLLQEGIVLLASLKTIRKGVPYFTKYPFMYISRSCAIIYVMSKWVWVKHRHPKGNPGKWKQGVNIFDPWWLDFDPYLNDAYCGNREQTKIPCKYLTNVASQGCGK